MSFLSERNFQILEENEIYKLIDSDEKLRLYMEQQVACVWFYQILLKNITRDILSMTRSIDCRSTKELMQISCALIMEEELDDVLDGEITSHLELFLESMYEVGCNMKPFLSFMESFEEGLSLEKAVEESLFCQSTKRYLLNSLTILDLSLHEKASALFYEGEPYIPDDFLSYLNTYHGEKVANLVLYYERHIEGLKKPGYSSTGRMIEILCESSSERFCEAESVAEKVMKNRISLWIKLEETFEKKCLNSIRNDPKLKLVYSA